jgi:L-lactate dehydrogenase complex protein LldF
MLVHLRSEAVDSARRRRLSPERSLMAAAAWTMADSERWTRALRAGRLGRLAARRRALPPPLSAWAAARDLPEPPRETFRDWWTREGQR